jgi:hypothetical protein
MIDFKKTFGKTGVLAHETGKEAPVLPVQNNYLKKLGKVK